MKFAEISKFEIHGKFRIFKIKIWNSLKFQIFNSKFEIRWNLEFSKSKFEIQRTDSSKFWYNCKIISVFRKWHNPKSDKILRTPVKPDISVFRKSYANLNIYISRLYFSRKNYKNPTDSSKFWYKCFQKILRSFWIYKSIDFIFSPKSDKNPTDSSEFWYVFSENRNSPSVSFGWR